MFAGTTLTNQYVLGYQLPSCADADVVYVNDHFDPDQLAAMRGSSWIISDFHWHYPELGQPWTAYPYWLSRFCDETQNLVLPTQYQTRYCFNFMMRKMRPVRRLALEVIEYHGLKTDCYTANTNALVRPMTVNYTGNNPAVIDFVNQRQARLLTPHRMFDTDCDTNITNFANHLHDNVFGNSAVALITEPIDPAWINSMNYSEKTVYAMLSHNFPIWIGGQAQATTWASAGFDVFDDVVDHSYQNLTDPLERMFYAVANNVRLLTDLEYISSLRRQYWSRLEHNRQLIQNNAVATWAEKQLDNCPNNVRQAVKACVQSFAG